MMRKFLALGALSTLLLVSTEAGATIVRFETPMGSVDVNLYDKKTPITVANFLSYVKSGAYNNVVMHRSVGGFVVQGGGYTFPGTLPLGTITTQAAITNEPVFSNVRGTIAMAKVSGNVNSATSQWFFNMADNSANLDVQNGGFTVFGEVMSPGMTVVDAMNALPTFSLSSAIDSMPLRNYTAANAAAGTTITSQNVVYATAVYVLDSNVDSATSLTPAANTLLAKSTSSTTATTTSTSSASSSGGGGSMGGLFLMLLGALALWRARTQPAWSSR